MPELHNLITKRECAIVDIDGTLTDASHRQHLVRPPNKRWDEFYDLCDQDTVQRHIAVLSNALHPFYRVVLVSGRVERVREKTVAWLNRHFISFEALYMRPDGDYRPDDILKAEILDRDILPNWTVTMAIDDRDRVVKMWRARGIPCLQVAEGNF